MGEMIDSPQAIYPQILAEIDKLLDALGNQSDNQEIEEYRKLCECLRLSRKEWNYEEKMVCDVYIE